MTMRTRALPAVAIVLMSACSAAPPPKETLPVIHARGEKAGLKIVWAVDAVDVAKRQISLRGPAGKTAMFSVGPEVQRLSEIHAGDTILADYQVSAIAELRGPTAEEENAPLILAEMVDRKPSNLAPGGTLARSVRMVVSIEAVNATAGTVTLKGPLEGEVVAKVDDVAVMPKLRAGQKIVVTFAETLILSVDPGPRK